MTEPRRSGERLTATPDEIALARLGAKKMLKNPEQHKRIQGSASAPSRFLTPPCCEACGNPVYNGALECPVCLQVAGPTFTYNEVADGSWTEIVRKYRGAA